MFSKLKIRMLKWALTFGLYVRYGRLILKLRTKERSVSSLQKWETFSLQGVGVAGQGIITYPIFSGSSTSTNDSEMLYYSAPTRELSDIGTQK